MNYLETLPHEPWVEPVHSVSACPIVMLASLTDGAMGIVFEGPVSRLEKDRDRTGPGPIKTGNYQDRSRP